MITEHQGALRTVGLTALTMLCFAANSILARMALRAEEIDSVAFTGVRLVSGAAVLILLTGLRGEGRTSLLTHGSWAAATALLVYALTFSIAYVWLDAGIGALILFATVQITMIGSGLIRGERPQREEWIGLAFAIGGLLYLVSPGLTRPPLEGAVLMFIAGAAWGFYSFAGKGAYSAMNATAANFGRAALIGVFMLLPIPSIGASHATGIGVGLAVTSGALTSGLGYTIWYLALRGLSASQAAIVQLTVPIIAAVAGVLFLDEEPTWRLALSGAAILGGIALALTSTRRPVRAARPPTRVVVD